MAVSARHAVGATVAGVVLGLLGAYADYTLAAGWFGGLADAIGNTAAGWLTVAVLVAWGARQPRDGAIYGAAALISAVVAYYLMTYAYGQRGVSPGTLLGAALSWSAAAVACGVLVGASVPSLADRSRSTTVLLCGTLGGALIARPVHKAMMSLLAGPPWGFHSATATEIVLALLLVVVGLAIPAGWPRGSRRALVACVISFAIGLGIAGSGYVRWSAERMLLRAPQGIEGTLDTRP